MNNINNLKLLSDKIRYIFKANVATNNNSYTDFLKQSTNIIKYYNGTDWIKYKNILDKYIDNSKYDNYKKIKIQITKPDDNFDIYLIAWPRKSKSLIHDHADNGCVFKLLEGNLIEELYTPKMIDNNKTIMSIIHKKIVNIGDVSYLHNSIGYHKIISNYPYCSYSLHIYSPPNYQTKYYTNDKCDISDKEDK